MSRSWSHVVMFSGGLGSWAAAKRVAERHGTENLILLFADTRMEDEDLYRFLGEGAANVGGELVRIQDGRDPWQVFFDERFLGNSRIDPCSKILKRELCDRWMKANNFTPENCVRYIGIDWSESHRLEGQRRRLKGWRVEAPLCDKPYLEKRDVAAWLEREGIRRPRLYDMGFAHNNCGGFCVKAGQAHFRLLLEKMPERFAYHEAKEQEIRAFLGRDVAVLTETKNGQKTPLTLLDFRHRIEAGQACDMFEWGGCGCFSGEEDTA